MHGHWFSLNSDVHLAARGIAPADFYVAVARLQDLPADFKIDLVDMDWCAQSLRRTIETDEIAL